LIPPAINARVLVKTEGKEPKYILTNISNDTQSPDTKTLGTLGTALHFHENSKPYQLKQKTKKASEGF
jgi:hypothetical protein